MASPESPQEKDNNPNGESAYTLSTEWARGNSFVEYDQSSRFERQNWNDFDTTIINTYGGDDIDNRSLDLSEIIAFESASGMYGDILSASGLNLQDPIKANAFYYNKSGKEMLNEPPQAGKTYVFFTRPDLNLSKANIESHSTFKWLYAQQFGREIFSMLTGPDREVYGDITGLTDEELGDLDLSGEAATKGPGGVIGVAKTAIRQGKGLYKAFVNLTANHQLLYEQLKDKIAEGYKNAKESIIRDISNTINEFYSWKNKIGKMLSSDAENEVINAGALSLDDKLEPENEDVGYIVPIINQDPEKKSKIVRKNERLAKNIPKFFDPWTREYGNTKTRPIMEKSGGSMEQRMEFNSAFIPLLFNNCLSIPAGKDLLLESFEYAEDFRGHKLNVPTNANSMNNSGEFTASFRDNRLMYVYWLFYVWTEYIWAVNDGRMIPRWSNIVDRILDYTCSVFIFVLGRDGQTILTWAKYTGCSPRSHPRNNIFHQATNLDSNAFHEISINFGYNLYESLDPELFTQFNYLSETEWRRKINLDEKYFTIANTRKVIEEEIKANQIWEYYDLESNYASVSGQVPVRAIPNRYDTSFFDAEAGFSKWIFKNTASMYDHDFDNHYGGYPYIINGRDFVWISPAEILSYHTKINKDEPANLNTLLTP